ncbi:formate C-acetyltransferase [Verrucomicrobiaceae bacterium N1E253]|uniref:Formate acetyltransferase n=1 Tax=Oceaniferula marina TaxID=2748318 RepID=A0A851GE92_9BACT|nr:formate C-acetyltransferase [Oceaniferula marina]NWK54021.1 formate C-acetyltransferase [Oceaniferula marina]
MSNVATETTPDTDSSKQAPSQDAWKGFKLGAWTETTDVRDFIQRNYTPYEGDESFLSGPSKRTEALWDEVKELMKKELTCEGAVLDADEKTVSSIVSHGPGYINKELEVVFGLQTDAPLKRALMPYGGLRMAQNALSANGYEMDEQTAEVFTKYRKTHNNGVFDAYTDDIRAARSAGIVTGLPDAYGRGRIIGDYRRVALYGTKYLQEERLNIWKNDYSDELTEENIRLREELCEQYRALGELEELGKIYGFDISRPAVNATEAVQWTYIAFLSAIKEQNGAAMSFGRVSTFIDIYIQRDIDAGLITEEEAQELMDQLVIKLRMVRFIRTPEYNALFSGDPTWVTEAIGGVGEDARPLVTKNSYRFLHTLYNLGPAPEPNLTVLWSEKMPDAFKLYTSKVAIETSSIQFESDDLMRGYWGDDYGIACCVSAMRIGKQMQFFGARVNLAKAMLYAINGGKDEMTGKQIAPVSTPITGDVLEYDELMERYDGLLDWLAKTYVSALNAIHYMHDKYAYERVEMALHDPEILRTMACGVAGISVAADAISAVKNAKVNIIRNEEGLAVDYKIEGDFPCYGNNDPAVDTIASDLVESFMDKIRALKTYRDAMPTQSVLTITSNVVYGKKTGNTPDGRRSGEPFAPGANPMHGRDSKGAIASMCSVAKLPYEHAQDGISYTFSIVPKALGRDMDARKQNLSSLLQGYFSEGGHHINVNVFDVETLQDAMEHPEKYPQLTVRVSGYAVNFVKLTREQQLDVITRTFHEHQ